MSVEDKVALPEVISRASNDLGRVLDNKGTSFFNGVKKYILFSHFAPMVKDSVGQSYGRLTTDSPLNDKKLKLHPLDPSISFSIVGFLASIPYCLAIASLAQNVGQEIFSTRVEGYYPEFSMGALALTAGTNLMAGTIQYLRNVRDLMSYEREGSLLERTKEIMEMDIARSKRHDKIIDPILSGMMIP